LEELHDECKKRAEITLHHLETRHKKPSEPKAKSRTAAHHAKRASSRSA
jgi:hypothetical protein